MRNEPERGCVIPRGGVTFAALETIDYAISDKEAARQLNEARARLFKFINQQTQDPSACQSVLVSSDSSGSFQYWKGFAPESSFGLRLTGVEQHASNGA